MAWKNSIISGSTSWFFSEINKKVVIVENNKNMLMSIKLHEQAISRDRKEIYVDNFLPVNGTVAAGNSDNFSKGLEI